MDRKSRGAAGEGQSKGRWIIIILSILILGLILSIAATGCFWVVEAPEEEPDNQEVTKTPEEMEADEEEEVSDPSDKPLENPGEEPVEDTGKTLPPMETPGSGDGDSLKIPDQPVELIPVDENFPGDGDVLKEETLTSEGVIRYFEEKYGHYGGSFTIQVSVAPDTFEEEGKLHHQREALYTLTRKEDDRIIGKEVFRQVFRRVPLNPSISDNLDGEYQRVVESDFILREIEERVIGKLNDARSEQGLPALTRASDLTRLARIKSTDMGLYSYFNHTSPNYGSPFEMADALGVSLRSENIQWATWELKAEEIHTNFMESPGHRENRMTEGFREVGVGVIRLENGYYVTELFR